MQHIKKIYLYLVSVIALIIVVIGGIMLLNMGLKTWVFTKADNDFYLESYRCAAAVDAQGQAKPVPVPTECTDAEKEEQRKEHEERRSAQKQREASHALAMIIIATPVWYFHWRLAKREA